MPKPISFTAFATLFTLLPTILTSGIPLVVSPGLNVSTNPNTPAHLPTCTNLTNAPTIPCYTKLNATGYLINYNLTSAEVCAPQENWSTCLLRVVYEVAGANCTAQAPGVSKCIPFDCASLNSTTCVQPRQSNFTGITMIQAQGWYAAWNVYSVHHHLTAWTNALDKKSSERAILAAVNPRKANTATSMLRTLIPKYGFNARADNAILGLLENLGPEPSYGNVRVRGESNTLSGTQWRGVLVKRLALALQSANARDGFEKFLPMVRDGAYSTRGLSGADDLVESLKD